jgi:hypothetical protein
MVLKLPEGGEVRVLRQSLQMASPFFREALGGSAPIPVSRSARRLCDM